MSAQHILSSTTNLSPQFSVHCFQMLPPQNLSEIFWRHSLNVYRLFMIHFKFLVCLLVCQLAYFLTEIKLIQGYLQFQMRYLSEIFWTHSQDITLQFENHFDFFVCLSVCQLAYFLTEIKLIWGYLQFWIRYLSENFWRLSSNIFPVNPNNFEFLVCLSVCQFGLLPY